jgi:peroxiredoxin
MDWSWQLPSEWKPKLLILVLFAVAAAATYRAQSLPDTTEARLLTKDDEAPNFALRDLDGKTHRLSDYRGKAIVLNFMATWCGPCVAELPILVKFAKEHVDDPIVVLGIDYDEPILTVGRFAREHGLAYPVLVDTEATTAAAYGVAAFPTTYFIDRDGRVRATSIGSFDGMQGDEHFRILVERNLGKSIAVARRERKHCTVPGPDAPNTLRDDDQTAWALSRVACACGCAARLLECDCGDKRGGREIREYFARLRQDPDLSVQNARQIVVWKYKDEYVW